MSFQENTEENKWEYHYWNSFSKSGMPEVLPMCQYIIHFLIHRLNSILPNTGKIDLTLKKKLLWLYSHMEVNFQKSPQNIIISTVSEERILTLETQYAFSGLIQWLQIRGSQVKSNMTEAGPSWDSLQGKPGLVTVNEYPRRSCQNSPINTVTWSR